MNPAHVLVPVFWLCWIAYWAIASRGAKEIERHEDWRSRLTHQLPLAAGAVCMGVPGILGGALERHFVVPTPFWQWTATVIVALGLAFSVWARLWLGGNWSAAVTVKRGHELIRSGPYALVRHPIYTGMLVALAGSAIAVGKWRALVGLALMTGAFLRKLTVEERFMREQFGETYARYREQVAMLVPFVV